MDAKSAYSRNAVTSNPGLREWPIDDTIINESELVRCDAPINAMSIDVEEHFQVSAFEGAIPRDEWSKLSSRVSENTDKILGALANSGSHATFFALGWVSVRNPAVIRRIVEAGHELASHGFDHTRVWTQSADEFRADVVRSKKALEDISGTQVTGYRAPSFSIGVKTPWAHDVLQESGYEYSSSIYPIRHDHYGVPSAPRFPFRFTSGGILEIPPSTITLAGRNLPAAGGGYFRLLPLTYSRWALRRLNRRERMPAAFYFHPWELDPEQPRVTGIPVLTRMRHYVNLSRFESRLETILREFKWGRMDQVYGRAIRPD